MTLDAPSASFASQARSIRQARHFCRDALLPVGADLRDAAMLVVTELATNAVLHARSAFIVTVQVLPDGVLLRVNDAVAAGPSVVRGHASGESGRGMWLVEQLSEAWGTTPDDRGGKAVWALLSGPTSGFGARRPGEGPRSGRRR
jgi:anti-sigma regulatory factor (Ser/Thr protein kinase)